MERQVYALLVAYDGGPFKGCQPHPELPTVGGVLAASLRRAGIQATPFGASRTDAGVHARGQVASFTSKSGIEPCALYRALNAQLPSSIRVRAARVAHRSFHSHWSSIGKVYRYRLSFCGEPHAWRLPSERFPFTRLELPLLVRALGVILSAEDVSAFCAEREPAARVIERADVLDFDERGTTLEVKARGFGKHLVRHLVAGAVGVAVGAYSVGELQEMLAGQRPRPPRAQADGLTLHRVLYPPAVDPFADFGDRDW